MRAGIFRRVSSSALFETRKGLLAIACAASSWATVPLFVKQAEQSASLSPFFQSFLLMSGVTLASAPLALRAFRARAKGTGGVVPWRALLALSCAEALNVYFLLLAYQTGSVAVAVTTHHAAPLLVALSSALLLGERMGRRVVFAAGVGFTGVLLMLSPWSDSGAAAQRSAWFGLASAAFFALNVLLSKRLTLSLSGPELLFWRALFTLPLLGVLVPDGGFRLEVSSSAWLLLAGVGPGALGGALFLWGLARVSASRASLLTLLEPLGALALSLLVLGEAPSFGVVAGGAAILVAAALVLSEPARGGVPAAREPVSVEALAGKES
jgi:drug/metabolite transporter (DMT)-like permease